MLAFLQDHDGGGQSTEGVLRLASSQVFIVTVEWARETSTDKKATLGQMSADKLPVKPVSH